MWGELVVVCFKVMFLAFTGGAEENLKNHVLGMNSIHSESKLDVPQGKCPLQEHLYTLLL